VISALPIWERLGFKPIGHITEQGAVYKISRTDFYDKVHST
jgi:hypothetical protein